MGKRDATPDVVKMDDLNRKRQTEYLVRKDWEKIKKHYPDLKYEDALIITSTAVKMKDGKVYRIKSERKALEEEYVNRFREAWGTNATLSKKKIAGMSTRELKTSIKSLKGMGEINRAHREKNIEAMRRI